MRRRNSAKVLIFFTVLVYLTLMWLVCSYPCDNKGCTPSPTIMGYICNWMEEPMRVMVIPHDLKYMILNFKLPPKSDMGKPHKYRGTMVPNCAQLNLPKGDYTVIVYNDNYSMTVRLKVCKRMPRPWEIDIEPEL